MAEDRSNKTEPATPKRKEDARKKGQIAISRDLSTAVILLSGIGLLAAVLFAGVPMKRSVYTESYSRQSVTGPPAMPMAKLVLWVSA